MKPASITVADVLEARRHLARAHIIDFARRIDVPGAPLTESDDEETFVPIETALAPHHELILNAAQRCIERHRGRTMLFLPPGSAKALALDTPIATPSGWTTMGELRVGDRVFDENGNPCNVVRVSPIWKARPVYAVTTDCGDTIIADRDHEWLVCLDRKKRQPLKANGIGAPARLDRGPNHALKETHQLVAGAPSGR